MSPQTMLWVETAVKLAAEAKRQNINVMFVHYDENEQVNDAVITNIEVVRADQLAYAIHGNGEQSE